MCMKDVHRFDLDHVWKRTDVMAMFRLYIQCLAPFTPLHASLVNA